MDESTRGPGPAPGEAPVEPATPLEFKGYSDDEQFKSVKFNRWEDIGFQRPLGDFLYGYAIAIITSIASVVFVSFLYALLWPYPEITGYYSIAAGLFALVYQLFDIGTAFGIVRFIAEWRIKDPKRMINYVQFYVWYQMMTGVVQLLIMSIVVLNVIRVGTVFAYLTWVFLIISQKQWPGMLGMFRSVLEGLQMYNKSQILSLVSGQVFQNLTNIIFILLGRYLGGLNPEYGELMGMVIGSAIGVYVDDFFAMWLSVHYLNKAMKPFGANARDCMRLEFDRAIVKECLWFGAQVSVVPLVDIATGTWIMLMYINAMPQYTTWITLAGLAGGIAGIVDAGNFRLTASIAESYMNGKKKLAQFYTLNTFKWNGFLMCFLTLTLMSVMPMLLTEVVKLPGLENYVLAVPFLIPTLIHRLFMPWISIPDTILIGTLKISFYTSNRLVEEANQVLFVWLFLYVWRLNVVYGFAGIVFILAFQHFFPRIIKMAACWIYINMKIFPVRVNVMQTFLIPFISSIPVLIFGFAFYGFIFYPLMGLFSFLGAYAVLGPAVIYILLGLLVFPVAVFLPLTGFLGGWDDFQLLTFRKAVDLSGPSKPIAMVMYKAILFGARRSKRHNKYKIPWDDAAREINELMEMKENQTAVRYEKPVSANAPWLERALKRRKEQQAKQDKQ